VGDVILCKVKGIVSSKVDGELDPKWVVQMKGGGCNFIQSEKDRFI
jgi:hypothetical protein